MSRGLTIRTGFKASDELFIGQKTTSDDLHFVMSDETECAQVIINRSEYLQIIKHGITQFGFNALELSTLHKHGEPYND